MWNERFALEAYAYGIQPNDFLKEHEVYLPRNGKVLCMAEGEGRNAVFLAKRGHQVTGVDYSEEGRVKALGLAEIEEVEIDYVISDLADYDFGIDKWDAVVFVFAHTESALRHKLYARIQQSLKPDGVFLLEAYTPEQPKYGTGGPRAIDLLIPISELNEHFEGYTTIRAHEVEREIYEGDFHTGLSSVSQFLVRKP